MISNNQEASGKAFEDLEMLGIQDPSSQESLLSTMSIERKEQMAKLINEIRGAASQQTLPGFSDEEVEQAMENATGGNLEQLEVAENITNMSDSQVGQLLNKIETKAQKETPKSRITGPEQMAKIYNENLGFDLSEEVIKTITEEYLAQNDIIFKTSEWPALRRALEEISQRGEQEMSFKDINAAISRVIVGTWQAEGNEGVPPVEMPK